MSTPIPVLDLGPEIAELRGELMAAIGRVLDRGQFILGPEVEAFEREVAAWLGVRHAVGVNSGTDALTIGLRALGIGPGDEVITTPFTFFATAESILHLGARPVYVDIEYGSFNLDPDLVEAAITERTRAIVPVHMFGRPAELEPIMSAARRHGLHVVEDCAQSFGARYFGADGATPVAGVPSGAGAAIGDAAAGAEAGAMTGSLGDVGAFSLYPTKNLAAYGDGGIITANDDEVALRLRKLRTHGSLVQYQNEMLGYNSRLDELQAAILRVKLPHVQTWNERRRELAAAYRAALAEVPGVIAPEVTPGHVFHQITLRVPGGRDALREALRDRGIGSMVYYPRLASELGGQEADPAATPVAAQAAREVLSLPIVRDEATVATVVDAVAAAMERVPGGVA